MTLNWLPTGKPMLVTTPSVPYPPSRLMIIVPQLAAVDDVMAAVEEQLTNDPTKAIRKKLITYYLGNPKPGVATKNFVKACEDAIAHTRSRVGREADHRRHRALALAAAADGCVFPLPAPFSNKTSSVRLSWALVSCFRGLHQVLALQIHFELP